MTTSPPPAPARIAELEADAPLAAVVREWLGPDATPAELRELLEGRENAAAVALLARTDRARIAELEAQLAVSSAQFKEWRARADAGEERIAELEAKLLERDRQVAEWIERGNAAEIARDTGPVARPLDEWHEEYGDVLWWKLPVCEPPYVGCPDDDGWPDEYYTHWTPVVCPANADEKPALEARDATHPKEPKP
jgi:hypothetical protein